MNLIKSDQREFMLIDGELVETPSQVYNKYYIRQLHVLFLKVSDSVLQVEKENVFPPNLKLTYQKHFPVLQ